MRQQGYFPLVSYPERIVPDETSPGIVALHLKRYEFAIPWSKGADVLDAGCGVGYGTAYLAQTAQRVIGVDRSAEALEYARDHYAAPNVEFVRADLLDLPLTQDSFDLVCAFETIEHLSDPTAFLDECARVLRPRGTLLVSTPRVDRTTREPKNPFHRIELSASDFERLLRNNFASIELYGQHRVQTRRHRLLQRLDVLGLRRRVPVLSRASLLLGTPPTTHVGLKGIVIAQGDLEHASELVAVCTQPRRR
jgi:SAM-dependent methyltransferase